MGVRRFLLVTPQAGIQCLTMEGIYWTHYIHSWITILGQLLDRQDQRPYDDVELAGCGNAAIYVISVNDLRNLLPTGSLTHRQSRRMYFWGNLVWIQAGYLDLSMRSISTNYDYLAMGYKRT